MSNPFYKEVEKIKSKIHELEESLNNKLSEEINEGEEKTKLTFNKVKSYAQDIGEKTERYMSTYVFKSIAFSLLAGIGIGKLI